MLNNFSPNMLKTYELCPKKFYFQYIDKITPPKSSLPFEKGKKIHALANYFLQGVNISRIETALSEEERRIWNLLLDNPFYRKDCLKSEFPLYCKLSSSISTSKNSFWVGGRLDAVVHDYEKYYILDYKTGSIPKNPEFDYQTMTYLLCLDKFLKNYDSLAFVYINLKDKQNYVIEFNEKLKSEYEQKLNDICERIVADNSYNQNFDKCKFCEYSKFCHK